MKKLIKGLYDIWLKERPAQLAAALSYYGMFSFAPVIFITLWVADLFLRGSQSSTQLYERLAVMLGEDAAALIQEMVMQITPAAQQTPSLVTWISIGALLFAAAGAFNQLQYALNRIWNVSAPINMKASTQIKRWLLFIVMVFGLGFLLVAAAMLNTVLAWLASYLRISSNYEAGSDFTSVLVIKPELRGGLQIYSECEDYLARRMDRGICHRMPAHVGRLPDRLVFSCFWYWLGISGCRWICGHPGFDLHPGTNLPGRGDDYPSLYPPVWLEEADRVTITINASRRRCRDRRRVPPDPQPVRAQG